MGYILLVTENSEINSRFKKLFNTSEYNLSSYSNMTSICDLIEVSPVDVVIIDTNSNSVNIPLVIQRIKTKIENVQILLLIDNNSTNIEPSKYINGFISNDFSENIITEIINSHIKNKQKADNLSEKNKELADSLYKLNVLYNTSSQFAGTLDVKKLLTYMHEGLDKYLSYDLTCTITFGIEDEPVLVINSLNDISLKQFLYFSPCTSSKTIAFNNDKCLLPGSTSLNLALVVY